MKSMAAATAIASTHSPVNGSVKMEARESSLLISGRCLSGNNDTECQPGRKEEPKLSGVAGRQGSVNDGVSPDIEQDTDKYHACNSMRYELQDESAKPFPAEFLVVLDDISKRYDCIAEACHKECFVNLHGFVIAQTADAEPDPVGFFLVLEVSKPAVIKIKSEDLQGQSVHEVERIAGHEVVVYVYLNESGKESGKEDTVMRSCLPCDDVRYKEHIEPYWNLLEEPYCSVIAVLMDKKSECYHEREEIPGPSSLKTKIP